jgi:sec-independent protein translocase protein TatA
MIGTYELAVVVVIAVLLFGPNRIPELARAIGKATGEFKKAQREVERGIHEAEIQVEREERIRRVARDMGIDTQGKTTDELLDAIRAGYRDNTKNDMKTEDKS